MSSRLDDEFDLTLILAFFFSCLFCEVVGKSGVVGSRMLEVVLFVSRNEECKRQVSFNWFLLCCGRTLMLTCGMGWEGLSEAVGKKMAFMMYGEILD
jgi:hypothetical protein